MWLFLPQRCRAGPVTSLQKFWSYHPGQSSQGLAEAHVWPQIYIWWNIPIRMHSICHTTYSSTVCGHDLIWRRHKIPAEVRCIKVIPGNGAASPVQLLCKIQRKSSYPPTLKRTGDTIPSLHGHGCLCQNQKETASRNVTQPWHYHFIWQSAWSLMRLSPSTWRMGWCVQQICEGDCLPQLPWTTSTTIQLQQQQPLHSMEPAFLWSSTQPQTMKVRRVSHFNLETRKQRQS